VCVCVCVCVFPLQSSGISATFYKQKHMFTHAAGVSGVCVCVCVCV